MSARAHRQAGYATGGVITPDKDDRILTSVHEDDGCICVVPGQVVGSHSADPYFDTCGGDSASRMTSRDAETRQSSGLAIISMSGGHPGRGNHPPIPATSHPPGTCVINSDSTSAAAPAGNTKWPSSSRSS
jgi:hypothetical protein